MRLTPVTAGCDCAACPFAKDGKPHRPVLAVGPSSSLPLAAIVAESPGSEEVDRGEPLVGPTGREFNNTLEAAGLPRNQLLLINAMCCRPAASRSEKDMHTAVNCCRPYVAKVLKKLPETTPMLICGKWAFVSITGRSEGHGAERGFIQPDIGTSTAWRTHRASQPRREVEVPKPEGGK